MGARSRRKGARLEREFAALLAEHGIAARRDLEQCRTSSGRDLLSDAPLCVQVKGGARPNPWAALAEAAAAAAPGEVPVAAVRRDREGWLVVGRAEDLLPMIAYWHCALGPGGASAVARASAAASSASIPASSAAAP